MALSLNSWYVLACRVKLHGFISKNAAEHGPLHSVSGSQSAQSWASQHSGLNALVDVAEVNCKQWD